MPLDDIEEKLIVARNKAKGKGADFGNSFTLPENLLTALEQAKDARALIPSVQEPLYELYRLASDEIEKQARLYQIDLVGWQLNRAADLAEARLTHLPKIKTRSQADAENERCAKNIKHWFEYYAWGVDPRPDAPLSLMPFGLFPFQERFVEWLDSITFKYRKSGVVEKARDMGATETFLRWMLHTWLYHDGFIGLVLSANEDLVDSNKDPSTLFEKLRDQIRLLPQWMLPTDFNKTRDMPYMRLTNADNGSSILGDAPTPNVGRQRRATVVGGDEYAAWANGGIPQYTSLSRTTNTFVAISSVQGKFNKFADLAHDGHTMKFEMDWREHPWRDDRWYNSLKFGYIGAAMTDEEIAQEVDRNYEASQPGRVLKNVREEYAFITWEEMVRGFAATGLEASQFYGTDYRPRLPDTFNWGRIADYGESARNENDTHIWAYTLAARPPESSFLSDSLFIFHSRPIEPIGASELEGFAFYSQLEADLGLRRGQDFIRRPSVNDMSHEAKDPKEVLLKQCGDNWNIPDLDFDKGRRKLVFHFEIIDKHLPNPFRPVLSGRCRIYFVALPRPDGSQEYFLAKDDRKVSFFVTPSATQGGFKRLRAEIGAWHYPPEERGKPVPKMRPKPVFDDIITTVRYLVARWGINAQGLTTHEKREANLSPEAKIAYIHTVENPDMQERLVQARAVELKRMEQDEKEQRRQVARFRPSKPVIRPPMRFRK